MPNDPQNSVPAEKNFAHTNKLIDATSPYLLQHAHNPVDWHPWGPEALSLAREQEKPIFLSIGYSACHWCHVMEREVFENPTIAALMNRHFVNIKVDREERPDLDEIYMLATQLLTGQGGWPMSVWLTPGLKPFYAGTYFPPTDGHGRPGFPRLELALADAWMNRRAEILEQADKIAEGIRHHADEAAHAPPAALQLNEWLTAAIEQAADRFDPVFGGLGRAPKFPPSQSLLLWVTVLRERPAGLSAGHLKLAEDMLVKTLDAMAAGGIYDPIGGGFARYSTDERWLVPHFEKMLYDNAQLAMVYALAAGHFDRSDYHRIARQTLDFWLREMRSEDGAFYSALDADSEGHEGKFYVWTMEQVKAVLSDPKDAELIVRHFGMTPGGNFEGGNILYVAVPASELALQAGVPTAAMQKRIDGLSEKLRVERAKRVPPGLDDKILSSWNGLMISAFAVAGRVLKVSRYLEAAHRAVAFVLTRHTAPGGGVRGLLRTSRNGHAHIAGYLEDYAFLLNGLVDLIESTSPTSLPGFMARKRASELGAALIEQFNDGDGGSSRGFSFTHDAHDRLFARLKNATDNATPSPNAVAIRALVRLARLTNQPRFRETALQAARSFAGTVGRQPQLFPTLLTGLLEDALPPGGLEAPAGAAAAPVVPSGDAQILSLSAQPPLEAVAPGDLFELKLTLHIAAGYHVGPESPDFKEGYATVARVRSTLPIEVTGWLYPEAGQIASGAHTLAGFEGSVAITAFCTLGPRAPAGDHVLRATVMAQPCTHNSCRPPERVTLEVPIRVREIKPA